MVVIKWASRQDQDCSSSLCLNGHRGNAIPLEI